MNERHDLAVLFSLLNKPIAEFTESEPFRRLEQEVDLIGHIEPFGLPEVKRLICCSNLLMLQKWAEKYNEVRELYVSDADFDVCSLLARYEDVTEFEKKILVCADERILGQIDAYFKKVADEKEQAKKERSSLKSKITKAKKKLSGQASQEASADKTNTIENDDSEAEAGNNATLELAVSKTKSTEELRVEELYRIIWESENSLKFYKEHASKTEAYLNQMKNVEVMDTQRQKAYQAIDEIKPPAEEEFLRHYIHSGELSAEEEENLRNYGFLQRFIELFEKDSYRNVAFPVLAKLYSENAVDLESDLIAHFISTHSRLLVEYLEEQYSEIPTYLEDAENRVFLEYSIKETVAGNNEYASWWNRINRATDWEIILKIAEEILDDSPLKIAVKLMHHVSGFSMDAFMELIQSEQAEAFGITPAEFMIEFVGQEAPEQKDLIGGYIRSTEQNIRKLRRRVAIREREINRHSQELFSALYQPLEQLERLAANLRISDGEIRCGLVAGHIINPLADLRESLSVLGLDTADDIEAWRKQSFVKYDPEKHRIPLATGFSEERVKLETLGFAYTDDEGKNKLRSADVYIPAPDSKHLKKDSQIKVSKPKQQKHTADARIPKKKKKMQNKIGEKKSKKFMQNQKGKEK